MKNFLLSLLLAPLTLFAQPVDASWLNVTVQTDNYGGESSWEIINSDSNIVAASPPLADNNLTNIMVFLPAGEYNFIMYDSFGDGICCSFGNGFFGITNACGLEEFNYEFDEAIDTIPFVLDGSINNYPYFLLDSSNWDDYGNETSFRLYYNRSSNDIEKIREIKITNGESDKTRQVLKEQFTSLDNGF